MTQRKIKQFIKLIEQEELPIKQLLLHFKRFSYTNSIITEEQQLLNIYLQELKQELKPTLTQKELFI